MTADPPDTGHLVVFGHTNAPEALRDITELLTQKFGITDYLQSDIGITVGTHVGPALPGLLISPKNREEGTSMKLGIVGLPNVGKSTLFNAITNAGAESANYPFCTIDPNVGVVAVPDERLYFLRDLYSPKKFTPAMIEFVDIAGLVRGASKERV